jgi:hypothetical protein
MTNQFIEIPATKQSLGCRKTLYSVGINDADYITMTRVNGKLVTCPYYTRWKDMFKRCYSDKFHIKRPTYKGCSVCEEWFVFSTFKRWMITQDWQGKAIDKDVIKPGNKVYSPESCCFISKELNNLLCDHGAARGKSPVGVSWSEERKKFQSKVMYNGKQISLGRFMEEKEASNAYIKAKVKILLEAIKEQTNLRIKNGLRLHAGILLEGLSD